MSFTNSALLLALVGIVGLAFVCAGLLDRVHALELAAGRRLDPDRHPPPTHEAFAPDGRPVLAVVASSGCSSCLTLIDELGALVSMPIDVRVLWIGEPGPAAPDGVEHHLISAQDAADARATATPHAVIVSQDGTVSWSGPVADIQRLVKLTGQLHLADDERTP